MPVTTISVIIPSRHREQMLWETVGKALAAVGGKAAEIIVVNDGDAPLEVPAELADKIRFFNNPGRGVSTARNFGAAQATGSILFFIDDDMWINAGAIEWISNELAGKPNTGAVYNLNWVYPQALNDRLKASKIGQYLFSAGYHTMWGRMGGSGEAPASGCYLYPHKMIGSCSFVIGRQLFDKVGGYNEKVIFQGEDVDLAGKLLALGVKIYCVFDVQLFHNQEDRLEIRTYLQRLANGYASEFRAVKAGLIAAEGRTSYAGGSRWLYGFFRITEEGWIGLHKLLPNLPLLRSLNNRLIGILSGLQRYKEWYRIIYKGSAT